MVFGVYSRFWRVKFRLTAPATGCVRDKNAAFGSIKKYFKADYGG